MRDESTRKGKVHMSTEQCMLYKTDTQLTKVPGERCTVLHHRAKECVLLCEPHCSLYN